MHRNYKKEFIVFTVILTFVLSTIIINKISLFISDHILVAAKRLVETENDMAIKRAFSKKSEMNIDVDNLITVIKNNKDEILQIDFKVLECEKLMIRIIEEMSKTTNSITSDGYIMYIPLGYITNSPLLVNLGPKIPVKISASDIVLGEVKTKVTEFGINNAMVEIYINLEVKITTSMPINAETQRLKYSSLVASKIITGKVPHFYNGQFTKESGTFNLPIIENM